MTLDRSTPDCYPVGQEGSTLAVAFKPDDSRAGHVHERHGADRTPRPRVVRLRVIGGTVELRDDVPRTTADCPTTRPCGHVRCGAHLWMVTGPDRPGRRHPNEGPRSSTLWPAWVATWPLPPSCMRDMIARAEREDVNIAELAASLGLSVSGFRYLLNKARAKARAGDVNLREFADPRDAGDEEP